MARAFLGIGGNLGYRYVNMRSAARRIREQFPLLAVSSLYETEPVGYRNQPAFLNAVLEVDAPDDPLQLQAATMEIENELGRYRTFTNAPRTIDIDILMFSNQVIETPELIVPHPRMHERAFVMVPLAEIAPDIVHARLDRSMSDIVASLGDVSNAVRIVDGPGWIDAITPGVGE